MSTLSRYHVIMLLSLSPIGARRSILERAQMAMATPLEVELRVFEQHRDEWSQTNRGKFVVIQDETILDRFFDDYADAFSAGLERFGIGHYFLVKQIWNTEPVYFVA